MTLKEDYLIALRHGKPESIPYYGLPVRCHIGFTDVFEKGPIGGGYDDYGVKWLFHNNTSCPATDELVLTDITKWQEQVKFPDLDAIDWKAKAEKEKAKRNYNPETQLLEYCMGNGPFERFLALAGYEKLIDFLLEYPDESKALLRKWTDERRHFIDLVVEHYNPDYITIYDDVAFERGLFVTMDMFEEFFHPIHKELAEYIKSKGIFAVIHCCGKAEALVEDFIEEGYDAWTSCQSMNDIKSILEKYHDKFTIIGGYDSNGEPSREDATEEDRINELHRAIDEYSEYGSFILGNMIFMTESEEERQARIKRCADELFIYGKNWYERHGK